MRDRVVALVAALRAGGVPVSVAEAIDAAEAAAAVGVERRALADALAAALVKDEGDRALFEACFARVFSARPAGSARSRATRSPARPRPASEGSTRGDGPPSLGGGGSPTAKPRDPQQPREPRQRERREPQPGTPAGAPRRGTNARDAKSREPQGTPERTPAGAHGDEEAASGEETGGEAAGSRARDASRERTLRALPFAAMSPRDVEEAAALVRVLARQLSTRFRRRLRRAPRGRLDFRRTLRAATTRGGVPLVRHFRSRRPRRPALVALCDLSASTATATDFFLALLAPATAYFARVRLFGFVDRLVEIEFVDGRVRPAAPIDLMARSDFGRVLQDVERAVVDDLGGDTVVLILGDARNNRRPPRADLLRNVRTRVRRVVWLNPDASARWNTGDSVIDLYARHVDALVACGSLAELSSAIAVVAR